MGKEEILAELPRLKEDLVYALQRLEPIARMIDRELAPFVAELRAKFGEVGRELAQVRTAHKGDHRTPVVFVQPKGKEPFGGTPEEKAVVDWLQAQIKERVGVAGQIEPGWEAQAQ